MAKPRSLTARQATELRRRYRTYLENHPKALAHEFNISRGTLLRYVFDRHDQQSRYRKLRPR